MVSKIVSIGDKIDLIKISNRIDESNTETRQYVSQLLDFVDDDILKIAMPIEYSRLIPLSIGDKYQMCFYTNKGLFQCTGETIDRSCEGKIYVLMIKLTSQLEKYQRRQYYRLHCVLDIEYRGISEEEYQLIRQNSEEAILRNEIENETIEWYPAVITDLSGGGARFNSTMFLQKGDKLLICIELHMANQRVKYELLANVISSFPVTNKLGFFENRVEFSEIDLKERETIIKFIFEEERKIRKREKGLG